MILEVIGFQVPFRQTRNGTHALCCAVHVLQGPVRNEG